VKELAKVQRIVSSNLDAPSDENDNGTGVFGRLNVHGLDLMGNLADLLQLFDDCRGSLVLLTFKCHHGLGVLKRERVL